MSTIIAIPGMYFHSYKVYFLHRLAGGDKQVEKDNNYLSENSQGHKTLRCI